MEEKENNECNDGNLFAEILVYLTVFAKIITEGSKKALEILGEEVNEKLSEKINSNK